MALQERHEKLKTVIVTAEPKANYHLSYFDKKHAKGLIHLVPDVNDVQGVSLIPVTDKLDVLDNAKLLVLTGGVISEWSNMLGVMANDKNVPVVFSELAYTQETFEDSHIPRLKAISATSSYGAFNLHGYAEHVEHVEVTGHPMLDALPVRMPEPKRVLVLSSEFQLNDGAALKLSIRSLEKSGWNVEVRIHPREKASDWAGFKLSSVPYLIEDLSRADVVVGVPGTGFAAAAAMHIPTLAVEGSTSDDVLPEYKYLFPYVKPADVAFEIENVEPLNAHAADFITGPVGGASDRIVAFWKSHESELHFTSNLNLNDLF